MLKLLQKTYFGRIKMIYIDPPYNTGNDFVYRDDLLLQLLNMMKIAEYMMMVISYLKIPIATEDSIRLVFYDLFSFDYWHKGYWMTMA